MTAVTDTPVHRDTENRARVLRDIGERLNRLQGERDSLAKRDEEIVRDVGKAKARIDERENVEGVLEGLQAEAHERAVGRFERMLTAIVGDVIDPNISVGLDLYTERGLPALDVYADRGDGPEDILEGTGGSVTNVVSLGLRMIALSQSGLRLFCVLDEPDCWISPDKIPAFAGVLNQLARYVGVQVLFVTHHDTTCFTDDAAALARLLPDERNNVVVEADPNPHAWQDDETGLRYVRLVNFMSHTDTFLPLGPGVNVLTGENNVGKSVFTRAFRAVAYGECSDRDIRHGEDEVQAEIGIEYGRAIRLSRKPKRNPRMKWSLVEADGSVSRSGGGRTPPDFVTELLGIDRVQGLDVQTGHQKKPVFVLGETPSTRAQVLSVGRESDLIRQMIQRHREWVQQDNRTIREGERELTTIRDRLARLDAVIDQLSAHREALQYQNDRITSAETQLRRLDDLSQRIQAARGRRQSAVARRDALVAHLPDDAPRLTDTREIARLERRIRDASAGLGWARQKRTALENLPADPPALHDTAAIQRVHDRIVRSQRGQQTAQARLDALAVLPADVPSLHDTDTLDRCRKRTLQAISSRQHAEKTRDALAILPDEAPRLHDTATLDRSRKQIADAQEKRQRAEAEQARIDDERVSVEQEMDTLIDELGGACPTCGQGIDRETVFTHQET